VLIHGDRDTVVPIGVSRAYVTAHPASRLVVIDDTAHFELIDPSSHAWPVVIQELQRLLA
jgi:pimeloyl-ACP methyl ester carboxylesterase